MSVWIQHYIKKWIRNLFPKTELSRIRVRFSCMSLWLCSVWFCQGFNKQICLEKTLRLEKTLAWKKTLSA